MADENKTVERRIECIEEVTGLLHPITRIIGNYDTLSCIETCIQNKETIPRGLVTDLYTFHVCRINDSKFMYCDSVKLWKAFTRKTIEFEFSQMMLQWGVVVPMEFFPLVDYSLDDLPRYHFGTRDQVPIKAGKEFSFKTLLVTDRDHETRHLVEHNIDPELPFRDLVNACRIHHHLLCQVDRVVFVPSFSERPQDHLYPGSTIVLVIAESDKKCRVYARATETSDYGVKCVAKQKAQLLSDLLDLCLVEYVEDRSILSLVLHAPFLLPRILQDRIFGT